MAKRNLSYLIFILIMPFIFLSTCYMSVAPSKDIILDKQSEEEISHTEILTEDSPDVCQQITPYVVSVNFDVTECNNGSGKVIITISEVSPYCGTATSWNHEIHWDYENEFTVIPKVNLCHSNWQPCENGPANIANVVVQLNGQLSYYVNINSEIYSFSCDQSPQCPEVTASLYNFYPTDFRQNRLWGMSEDIRYVVEYTTWACGCSTFYPLVMRNSGENYFIGDLMAQICEEYCCWTCDCIDVGQSEQIIRNSRRFNIYEAIFNGNYRNIKGMIVDSSADPLSECIISPATILSASPTSSYFIVGEPIELQITIRYDSTGDSCCEHHTEVAFDYDEYQKSMYIFAYKGDCLSCNDDKCPESETKTLTIPGDILGYGIYSIYELETNTYLGMFSVIYGE